MEEDPGAIWENTQTVFHLSVSSSHSSASTSLLWLHFLPPRIRKPSHSSHGDPTLAMWTDAHFWSQFQVLQGDCDLHSFGLVSIPGPNNCNQVGNQESTSVRWTDHPVVTYYRRIGQKSQGE